LSDDEEDVQGEEVCSDDEDLIDGPCDEDDEEADDLCEDTSSNDGEEGEREVADGSHISDSVQDDSEEEEEDWGCEMVAPIALPMRPLPWGVQDDSEEEEEEEEEEEDLGSEVVAPIALPMRPVPLPWGVQLSDSDDDTDSESSSGTDSDDSDYDLQSLPASLAVVESLPEATLSEEETACGCSVCKDDFTSGQRVDRLPCKHYFHGDCIRSWLAIRSTCPVCRYQLLTGDAESPQRQAPQWWFQLQLAGQGGTHQV
jgi:hypothetical protein